MDSLDLLICKIYYGAILASPAQNLFSHGILLFLTYRKIKFNNTLSFVSLVINEFVYVYSIVISFICFSLFILLIFFPQAIQHFEQQVIYNSLNLKEFAYEIFHTVSLTVVEFLTLCSFHSDVIVFCKFPRASKGYFRSSHFPRKLSFHLNM